MFKISKLFVMHRKFWKFVKSLEAISTQKKFYLTEFPWKEKSAKHGEKRWVISHRGFSHTRNQTSRHLKKNLLMQMLGMTKRRANLSHQGKIFNILVKYLNFLSANLDRRVLWKSQFSQISTLEVLNKNKTKTKNIWTKADSFPYFLKRHNSSKKEITMEESQITEGAWSNKNSLDSLSQEKYKQKEIEIDNVFKRLTEQYNGIADQKLYTQSTFAAESGKNRSPKLSEFSKSSSLKRENEEGRPPPPPPQRCRLSCPLPPPEFNPPEHKEFISSHQSPSVKFSSQPAEFLPPKNSKNENQEYYSLQTTNRLMQNQKPQLKRQQQASESKPSKIKKIYPSNFKQLKSHIYDPTPDVIPKMKALLFEPNSLTLNYFAVDAPTQIYKDEVLVQVVYSGVCGTDLFITEGKMFCRNGPVILGHEISGKVYAVGSDVHHVKSGDNVAVNPYTACCVCRYCTRGFFSSCLNEGLNNSIGIFKDGGWAEFVVVKKSQIHKVPANLGLDQAALVQPLSCVLSAMSKLNLSSGLDILIQGLGLTGCLWASVLHAKGHKNVFVSDKNEKKQQQFQSLNLGYTFIPMEEVGSYSADIIIECTGSTPCIEKSLKILNPNGQICFFGKPNPGAEVRCIPYEIVRKEITIVGNTGNAFCFSKAIDLATVMGYRYLDFEKLGVKVFDLQDFREAFQMKKSGEVGKIMFKFES